MITTPICGAIVKTALYETEVTHYTQTHTGETRIDVCGKRCGWEGGASEKVSTPNPRWEGSFVMCCPKCGNDYFFYKDGDEHAAQTRQVEKGSLAEHRD